MAAVVAPTHVSHHDATRAAVSTTALGVCAVRVWESKKDPSERLIYDPFAAVLCGDDSPEFPLQEEVGQSKEFWMDFIGVRSHWIDQEVVVAEQLVILGAGLDTRAYRLPALTNVPVFEVDFQEVLEAKATLLEKHLPVAKLHSTPGNLVLDSWELDLQKKGFRRDVSTMWLLEGLTGYLTEAELETLLGKISSIAPEKSLMTATFVGQEMRQNATSMHRYLVSGPEQISTLLDKFGWTASVNYLGEVATKYNRTRIPKDYAYFLASAVRRAESGA